MRTRILLAFLLFIILWLPANSQEPIHLPVILGDNMIKPLRSTIAITIPFGNKNHVLNPSGEIDGNFANEGGGIVTRSTFFQRYGLYSYEMLTTNDGDGINLDLLTLDDLPYFVTFRVHSTNGSQDNVSLNITIGTRTIEAKLLEKLDRGSGTQWDLYGASFVASEANGETNLLITQRGATSSSVYLDGVQVAPMSPQGKYDTYIDGSQDGCRWLGAPNASASIRSADSRAGGVVRSFWEGYGFFPEKALGMGTAVEELNIDSYAFLPGGELNSSKIPPREFTIIGYFLGDTVEELHEQAQALELELGLNTYPGRQPVRLRYFGAKVQKEISAHYTGGLEGDLPIFYNDDSSVEDEHWTKNFKFKMRASIQFVALDPFWYEVGESSTLLDTNDTATLRYITGRLTSTGQWSNLNLGSDPTTNGDVFAIVVSPFDGKVYIGGDFTGWNGVAGRDYVAAYDLITGTWETVGGASDFNGAIRALVFGPDGTLYAGGIFTNVAGNANADFFAQKPPGAGWTNLGSGGTGLVSNITIAPNGDIYIGGNFDNWAGIASADKIAYYDISAGAWSAVIAGANEEVRAIVWLPDMSRAYFGGEFTNWGDANGDYIVSWDGVSLSSLSTGADNEIYTLVLTQNGILYIGGAFGNIGGVAASGVASYNGQVFQPLGSGIPSPDVEKMIIGPDGMLYLVGFFSQAGGLTLAQSAVRWNGYTYAHLDVDIPSTFIVWTIAVGPPDSIINKNYDIFLGFDSSGTGAFAGLEPVQNEGTISAFPKIIFYRSGGDEAIIQTLRNERTGRELLFNYSLLDGESLTIDLNPKNRTITSSFFGPRMNARLANDDFSVWQLLPGENPVSSFVSEDGSPDVVAYVLFREPYKSWN